MPHTKIRGIRSADGPPGAQVVLETLVRIYETWGMSEDAEKARTELAALLIASMILAYTPVRLGD